MILNKQFYFHKQESIILTSCTFKSYFMVILNSNNNLICLLLWLVVFTVTLYFKVSLLQCNYTDINYIHLL